MTCSVESAWLSSLPMGNTRNAYRWGVAHFKRWCEGRHLDVLAARPCDVVDFRDALLADDYAPSTVRNRLYALTSFYRFALDTGTITRSPLEDVDPPRVSRKAPTPLGFDHPAYAVAAYVSSGVRRYVPPVIKSRRRAMDAARDVLRGSPCGWCGNPWDETFHVDHIRPIARGGSHDLDNLTASCARCNLSKGAKDWGWPPYRQHIEVSR